MAILARKTQKIFASSNSGGTDFGNVQFGSNQAGTPIESNDVAILQSLAAYTAGWEDATLSGENLPVLGEDQGLHYIETYQISYVFQEGISEYDSGTEYRINSIVKKSGTVDIYKSLADANTGNALTDGTKWSLCGNLSNLPSATLGTAAYIDTGIVSGKIPLIGTQSASTSLAGLTQLADTSATNTGTSNTTAVTPASLAAKSGLTAQVVNFQTGAVATGTTQIPYDDSVPQNSEGDQYMSLSITPKSSTNKLKIEVIFFAESSVVSRITAALFQDSTANALIANSVSDINSSGASAPITLSYYMTAGTTSPTTFKVRGGADQAATLTFNGRSGGRIFGGVLFSSITITEIIV